MVSPPARGESSGEKLARENALCSMLPLLPETSFESRYHPLDRRKLMYVEVYYVSSERILDIYFHEL
jgi:hypothetical protein